MTKKQLERFSKYFTDQTGFDVMEKMGDETRIEVAQKNIQWLRDWAEENAQDLEKELKNIVGVNALINQRLSKHAKMKRRMSCRSTTTKLNGES